MYVLRSVRRPTEPELRSTIYAFCASSATQQRLGPDSLEEGLPIIGEACWMLEDGVTAEEMTIYLCARGLDRDCAESFVQIAEDIVRSNRRAAPIMAAPRAFAAEHGGLALLGLAVIGTAIGFTN